MKGAVKFIIGGVCVVVLSASCRNEKIYEPIEQEETVLSENKEPALSDTSKYKFDFTIANVPSAATSMQEVTSWKVPFTEGLLNKPAAVNKYQTEFEQSLNLGVYNMDMAYLVMSNNGAEILPYLKSILQLSDKIGLKNAIIGLVGNRAENNLSNRDTLFAMLDEIFIKSDSYLRTNDRLYTASVVFAGSWIENLYLSSQMASMVETEAGREKVKQYYFDQRFHLSNLINLLGDFSSKKGCNNLIAVLKTIQDQVSNASEPAEITDANILAITSCVSKLRAEIVKG